MVNDKRQFLTYYISSDETKLIRAFGYGHLIGLVDIISLYDMCMRKAFNEGISGPHVEALRRGCNAISQCKPYRETEEFDVLVRF